MNTKNLGRLEKVSLRDLWASESGDFTPWLALPENLKLLGEAIGIDLELEAQEKDVGPFRLDLLCKESESGRTVVIENQIEETDHPHLGQLLTYAAGLDAAFVIWVARSFTDEHRAALDWLNEKTNAGVRFFGVEIEAWRIGDSAPAPKFNIVSEPNESSDRAKQAVREVGLNETEQLRIKFWTALTAYMKSAAAAFQCNSVAPSYWLRIKSPLQGFRFGFEMSARDQYIDAYVGSSSEDRMNALRRICREHKEEFERELGEKVDWEDNKGSFWISVFREDDPSNADNWPRQHQWMKEAMDKLLRAVSKHVRSGSKVEPEADQRP
jgi:hypothetical protein